MIKKLQHHINAGDEGDTFRELFIAAVNEAIGVLTQPFEEGDFWDMIYKQVDMYGQKFNNWYDDVHIMD